MNAEGCTASFIVRRNRIGIPYSNAVLALTLWIAAWIAAIGFALPGIVFASERWDSLQFLGREIEPGSSSKFLFVPENSFEAAYLNTPVFVSRGIRPGPTLCLAAGVHGDELNGVEVARRAFQMTDPQELRGTIVVFPAINAEGVRAGNRYLSDRSDLNRAFSGDPVGGLGPLMAYYLFSLVVKTCDALIDLHTGTNRRTNLPQIRADLSNPAIRDLAVHFGVGIVIGGQGPVGSLRRATVNAGIPAIIYEAGEPLRFQEDEIARGVKGVRNVMAYLGMIQQMERKTPATRVFYHSQWVRTPIGKAGFFFPAANLGDDVRVGDKLGRIIDPYTDVTFDVTSPFPGKVIGMAVAQPVLSGYLLFHVAGNESN